MKKENYIQIHKIDINDDYLIISYIGLLKIEAWLEDKNKHYPYILSLNVDISNNNIRVENGNFFDFIKHFSGHIFKLSLCTTHQKIHYSLSPDLKNFNKHGISVFIEKNTIYFSYKTNIKTSEEKAIFEPKMLEIKHQNKSSYELIKKLPVELLCIGSCFSRSIFRSDSYFNPTYKKYFHIYKTLFHNSLISLFSNAVEFDYCNIDDLTIGDAGKYIGIEFSKNIKDLLLSNDCRLIVVDNYIDATTPVIAFNNSYLTYNKYFSESIFKRYFSSCKAIYPASDEHLMLYQKSINSFKSLLSECGIKNVVLIGGRLSKYRIIDKKLSTDLWHDKMKWIIETNKNWDLVDKIFLQEFPSAIYIDKRKTAWKSDIQPPIIGGASPSHYQSGFYKEIFNELLDFIDEDFLNE